MTSELVFNHSHMAERMKSPWQYIREKVNHKTYLMKSFEKQQRHRDELSRQMLIRYERHKDDILYLSLNNNNNDRRRRERYAFPLELDIIPNTTIDTLYHGSAFITDWLLDFTNGRLKLTFDQIFQPLIDGIRKEGTEALESHLNDIIDHLYTVKNDNMKLPDQQRMKKLEEICAKLYTKQTFLFSLVNRTLREHNREKVSSVGPYCYLLYNYVDNEMVESVRKRHRFRLHSKQSRSMIVYRGDFVTQDKIEEYRQAVGKKDKCFKWLPFVSTSLDEHVAIHFGKHILYEIELCCDLTNDQFIKLEHISFYQDEKEVLLRPGVRFLVHQVKFDQTIDRERVYIKVLPSYISNLT